MSYTGLSKVDRAFNRVLRRGLCSSQAKQPSSSVLSANVRKTFIDYFERDHNHLLIPSSPVLPHRDPSLSFVNSGMNQFKRVFLGRASPASGRVVNSQKCIRIKGRHDDSSLVGLDGTHHTFFEMLGNWSFGDYFKREACLMSWNLLTRVYGIPPERLYVTYFDGDPSCNLPPDLETREIWAEIGVPSSRILPFGMKENFWEMARTGPCGPCTEIHFSRAEGLTDASSLVNSGSPAVTELWNIVFMQYNRLDDLSLEKLDRRFVDTGMGFERLVAILQGQTSNYETDLFRPLFDAIRNASGHTGYTARYEGNKIDADYRILADHARMLTVALSDGVIPNMHNRVRAVFRKAFAIGQKTFNVERGLVKELTNYVADSLAPVYPEIGRQLRKVQHLIDEEEESYHEREVAAKDAWCKILRKHPKLGKLSFESVCNAMTGLEYLAKNVLTPKLNEIDGETAWKLVDTYGMSLDAVGNIAIIMGLNFSRKGYDDFRRAAAERERNIIESKCRADESGSVNVSALSLPDTDLQARHEPASPPASDEITAKVLAIFVDGESVDSVSFSPEEARKRITLLLDRTNLLPEHAEHISDSGVYHLDGETSLNLVNVRKVKNQVLHDAFFKNFDKNRKATISLNTSGRLAVNENTRTAWTRSNTALHLFRAVISQKLNTFIETSSRAFVDKFTFSYTTYNETLSLKDIMDLEKAARNLVKNPCRVEVQARELKELREMRPDLIVRPGHTFIEPEIPVVRFSSDSFNARWVAYPGAAEIACWNDVRPGISRDTLCRVHELLACCRLFQMPCTGFFVKDTSDLQDFFIIDCRPTSYRTKELTCVVGEKALKCRAQNNAILEQWDTLRDFHLAQFEDAEAIEERLKLVQSLVKGYAVRGMLSYHIKKSILEETSAKMELLNKTVARQLRSVSRFRAARTAPQAFLPRYVALTQNLAQLLTAIHSI